MDMAARLDRLEAESAIRRLKGRYAYWADAKYTADHERKPDAEMNEAARQQSLCFTEDAVWDGGDAFGVTRGREAIYDSFRTGPWTFAMHYFTTPWIDVDGNSAKARWMLFETATRRDGTALWMGAHTDDEYRNVEGEWLISKVTVHVRFLVPFSGPDWAQLKNKPW